MQRVRNIFFMRGAIPICLIGAVMAGPASSQTCVEPAAGMVGWWPGDGDSVDVWSGLHGVAMNGASYSAGLVGDAFDFNVFDEGQDDRVDLPAAALDGLEDFTIEMWVQSVDDQGAWISGAGAGGDELNNEFFFFQGLAGLQVAVSQQSTGSLPVFLNDGAWHHVAFVREGSMGIFYVDGVVADARSVPSAPLNVGPGGLMLAQEQDCLGGCLDPVQGMDGLVDEISVYDRALGDAEIVAIFEAAEAGKCKPISSEDLALQFADLMQANEDLDQENADLEGEVTALETEVDGLQGLVAELEAELEAQGTGSGAGDPSVCDDKTHDRRKRWKRRVARWKSRHAHRGWHH